MATLARRMREFVTDRISDVLTFDVWERTRRCQKEFFYNAFKALSFNGIDGDYAEFGCHGAQTFGLAWRERQRHKHSAHFWAFDSFEGLPPGQGHEDEHLRWRTGSLSTSLDKFHRLCRRHGVPRDGYTAVPGFYEESLGKLAPTDAPSNIALVYIDCDMCSSTRAVMKFLMPRLKHGMILAFDDYFCWSPTQMAGERKALLECFPDDGRWRLLPYMQYGWHGQSFVIEAADA